MRKTLAVAFVVVLLISSCTNRKTSGPTGRLRVGSTDSLVKLPWEARSVSQSALIDQLYDPLVTVDILGNLQSGVARTWAVSEDKLSWTFSLGGRTFSDGKPITAQDVKSSIEKVAAKTSVSPAAAVLEVVTGFIDYHDKATAPNLAGVQVVDDATVKITLDEPWADLPTALSAPAFGIAPSAPKTDQLLPATSGPFKFKQSEDSRYLLVPRSPSGSKISELDWRKVDNASALTQASNSQSIDIALGDAKSRYVRRSPYGATLFYGLNLKKAALQNLNLRTAIIRAVDRRALIEKTYGRINPSIDGVIPKGMVGWESNICGVACGFDVNAAKAALAQVDLAAVPIIHIDIDGSETQRAIANGLKESLTSIGLKAELREHSESDYPTFLRSGEQELFQIGRIAEYYSADAVVWPLFASGSADNVFGLSDPAVDSALAEARKDGDPVSRAKRMVAIEKLALGQSIALPLAQVRLPAGVAPRIRSVTFDLLGSFDAAAVTLK